MPSNYNQYQPYTGFFTKDPNTSATQDLGQRYITKAYLLDAYPNLVPGRISPGLYAWGFNNVGVLGINSNGSYGPAYSSPIQVGALTNWKQISVINGQGGAYDAFGVKTDGSLWFIGGNGTYSGLNNSVSYSSPVQIGTNTNWKFVTSGCAAAGNFYTFAITTDGRLYSWGDNAGGLLGTGVANTSITYSSPVQVGALTNWKQVSVNDGNVWAIKTDGTLWGWGNSYGLPFGAPDSPTTNYSSPIQVGSLNNWRQVAAAYTNDASAPFLAVKTDGTLWFCGYTYEGISGTGVSGVAKISSPVQIGTLNNWQQVACGYQSWLAVKTDGTLWACGSNQYGQIPNGSFGTYYSSPIQIGSLTNWKYVYPGGGSGGGGNAVNSYAIKTDGTLWAWGGGPLAPLPNGTTAYYFSPIQIGSLTGWKSIAASHYGGTSGEFAFGIFSWDLT